MSTFDGYIAEFPTVRIDAFSPLPSRPAGLVFLLSHVHTDHLRGLPSFRSPFIYCTHATRQLLLRLETRFHRLNFATGTLEARRRSYKHLERVLRPLPLGAPTQLETKPGEVVRVTALDANHCPGACMFLLQGGGRNVLYTGDIRAEVWWVDRLVREPVMVPFATGRQVLDCVYLDTTFVAEKGEQWGRFPQRKEGLDELLEKVARYPDDTVFYLDTWTFGYEEVWVALANFLGTRVHVDAYRWRLYRSLADGQGQDVSVYAPLVGFQTGNRWQPGCLTREDGPDVRIHSCERGMGCEVFKDRNTVQIRAIITRHKGIEYTDNGEGGGYGDLNQMHELELSDIAALGRLIEICSERLKDQPEVLARVTAWLTNSVEQGARNIRLDTEAFYHAMSGEGEDMEELDRVPIDRLVGALDVLVSEKRAEVKPPRWITFPYSRHASCEELRHLVGALKPQAVFPNTVAPGMDMDALFSNLLASANGQGGQPSPPPTATNVEEKTVESKVTAGHDESVPLPSVAQYAGDRKRKRPSPSILDMEEVATRRHEAYKAALDQNGLGWAAIELVSVKGYHNDEEYEL